MKYKINIQSNEPLNHHRGYTWGKGGGFGYGYGHAKQALFELIVDKFKTERERYNHYMTNLNEIDSALAVGAEKAGKVADKVLNRIRNKLGY